MFSLQFNISSYIEDVLLAQFFIERGHRIFSVFNLVLDGLEVIVSVLIEMSLQITLAQRSGGTDYVATTHVTSSTIRRKQLPTMIEVDGRSAGGKGRRDSYEVEADAKDRCEQGNGIEHHHQL